MNQPRSFKTAAFAMAGLVTFAMLGGIDRLAHEQHAAVQMSRAHPPSQTAVAKAAPPAPKRG